jgi:hypothetical protein
VNSETPRENTKLLRLAILVSIISSALSAFFLLRLNGIVHGQLYDFGLQFSVVWASPYWNTESLIYACSAIPPLVGGLALAVSILKTSRNKTPVVRRIEAKPVTNEAQPVAGEAKPVASQAPVKTARVDNSMLITCPKCKKVFGRPLNMLDFSKGPAQLVNVCPYCNYILGSSVEEDSDSTKVILPDKTEIEQK